LIYQGQIEWGSLNWIWLDQDFLQLWLSRLKVSKVLIIK
jgi:hypothetical protein